MLKSNGPGDDMQNSNTSGLKRQRVALACNPCRARKSRCNGARPRCDLCERMAFECVYETPASAANVIVPKDAFADVESRLHVLEEMVKRHNELLTSKSISSVASSISLGHNVVNLKQHAQELEVEQEDDTDGMAISFVDEKDQGFFGPSANISFMRIILRSMLAASPMSYAGTDDPAPEDVTEQLLQEYFSNTGMLFPYIHETSFMDTYRQARLSAFAGVRRTWLALLNIVLAIAIQADASRPDTSLAAADAELFFCKARNLCGTHMLRSTTLETVQYLLLSTQYLQGTQHAVQTWTMHGLAVKTALSIGLHSGAASAKFAPVECEMRKRTWYGCIVLDRSLSMTFGRPSAIPEEYVWLDLPMPIERDREGGLSALFFSATITLYRILGKIIASVYGHNIEHEDLSASDLITRIIQLEQDLDQWRIALPKALAVCSSSSAASAGAQQQPYSGIPDEPSPASFSSSTPPSSLSASSQQVDKLRNILTLRYLNTKLLLLRPILINTLCARFLLDKPGGGGILSDRPISAQHPAGSPGGEFHTGPLGYMQNSYMMTSCFRAAVESISIVHEAVTRPELGRHMLGAWWFTLCYAFNASLTVLGTLLLLPTGSKPPHLPPVGGHLHHHHHHHQNLHHDAEYQTHHQNQQQQEDEGREAIAKAIEALGVLTSEDNALVDRCVEHLRQLMQVVDGHRAAAATAVLISLSPTATNNNSNDDNSNMTTGTGSILRGGGARSQHGDPAAMVTDLLMDETSILGMSFPDYHAMMLEDELEPGLFFRDDTSQSSWLNFGYQL
ncbi:fungal-specific transcription factor domain-containing protein [Microdochium trichocladiopsis]|uniref:Fungal-specific transcription factor domain-containing protein n=1 Tax=Microdochium trichocladiopsis TaxID=1682393 RepID=A0A9P8Y5H1_9PEZI|nr:fungal-specific transcription factor domain-containing protein [Microdochium trichocladiopsis]KAH7029734.1 fungal-specific transcription factor domain-containing protein [Microdochium trichocladiopsis]